MIKFIKKWICKIFHIKQCACPTDIDEHIEYFTKTEEPDILEGKTYLFFLKIY